MGWICAVQGGELENTDLDRRKADRLERYAVSRKAVYFDGRYLPLEKIIAVRSGRSVYRPHHCCGIGLPVFRIRLDCPGSEPVVLILERESSLRTLLQRIREASPGAVIEEAGDGRGGGEALS